MHAATGDAARLAAQIEAGRLSAQDLLGHYCALLYQRLGTYAEVAERTGLDRRTARKYAVAYGAKASAGVSGSERRKGAARDR